MKLSSNGSCSTLYLSLIVTITNVLASLRSDMRLGIVAQIFRSELDKHVAIQDVSYDELLKFVKSYLSHLYIQCLVQGNMVQEDVIEKIQECIGILQYEPLRTRPVAKIGQLPLDVHYSKVYNLNPIDVNSVVLNYYQLGIDSDQMRAMINLIVVSI